MVWTQPHRSIGVNKVASDGTSGTKFIGEFGVDPKANALSNVSINIRDGVSFVLQPVAHQIGGPSIIDCLLFNTFMLA